MSSSSPFGPLVPLGRRGHLSALGLLVAAPAAGIVIVLLTTGAACPTDAFGAGSGDGRSPERPLLVDSTEALTAVAGCPDRHQRQVADLAPPNPWTPVGLDGTGAAFSGSYDGGGHRLTGVRVFLPGSDDAGVFGVVDGEIRDLVLVDVVVEAADRAGAVVGRVGATGRVEGVEVRDGTVRGGVDVGGLVGLAHPDAVVGGTFDGGVATRVGTVGVAPLVGRVGDLAPVTPGPEVEDAP